MTKQSRKYCKSQWEAAAYLHYKLFCPIMFSGRDQNLTFTQLEQRGQVEITETTTSDSFVTSFISYLKVRRQSVRDESKSSLGCTSRAMYFSGNLNKIDLFIHTISDSLCGEYPFCGFGILKMITWKSI